MFLLLWAEPLFPPPALFPVWLFSVLVVRACSSVVSRVNPSLAGSSRSSVCRKVSQGRQVAIWPGSPPCRAQELAPAGKANARSHLTCLESRFGSGVKGSTQDPNNGMTASLPLGSTHGLQIFVVWPAGASPGIKRLSGIEFPDPPGLSPGNLCKCMCTCPSTQMLQWRSASCKQKCSTGARSNSVCFVTAF